MITTLTSILFTLAVTLAGLMVLVFVHELGHFLFAKLFGVRCDVFSIGFGRTLLSYKYGETDYRLCLIPLGGYVKLAGQEMNDTRSPNPDELAAKPWYARFLVYFGGPLFNILFAFVVFSIFFMIGSPKPEAYSQPPIVGYVLEDTAGAAAGVQPGDRILSVNGSTTATWEKVFHSLIFTQEENIPVTVERGGETLQLSLPRPEEDLRNSDFPGFSYNIDPVIDRVMEGSPAQRAGLQAGDTIVAIDDQPVSSFHQLGQRIEETGGYQALRVAVQRQEQQLEVSLQPEVLRGQSKPMIGVVAETPMVHQGEPVMRAIERGKEQTVFWSSFIFVSLGKLVYEDNVSEQLGGPARIADVTAQAARNGFTDFLEVLGILSVNLALMNLLPIPVLDGGHILFLFMEMIIGRKRTDWVKAPALQVGLFLILGLTVFVIFNDVRMIVTGQLFD